MSGAGPEILRIPQESGNLSEILRKNFKILRKRGVVLSVAYAAHKTIHFFCERFCENPELQRICRLDMQSRAQGRLPRLSSTLRTQYTAQCRLPRLSSTLHTQYTAQCRLPRLSSTLHTQYTAPVTQSHSPGMSMCKTLCKHTLALKGVPGQDIELA